jgi:ferric-dicitrate binding protein FerR (iron transport regulator)
MKVLVLLTLILVQTATAADDGVATVMIASPTTTFAGKKVSENEVLKTIGTFKTGTEGGAKIKLTGNEVVVEMAANSEINLVLPPSGDPSDSIELIKGKVRVRVPKAKNAKKGEAKSDKPRFLLRHRKVTMGVRGTDFYAVANDDLDETELVVFQGEVEFTNENGTSDKALVDAGYWSGIGGRFGNKIHAPMKLSKPGLDSYEKSSHETPSYGLQAVPTEKVPEASQNSSAGH